jgi:hypothetical protein
MNDNDFAIRVILYLIFGTLLLVSICTQCFTMEQMSKRQYQYECPIFQAEKE